MSERESQSDSKLPKIEYIPAVCVHSLLQHILTHQMNLIACNSIKCIET